MYLLQAFLIQSTHLQSKGLKFYKIPYDDKGFLVNDGSNYFESRRSYMSMMSEFKEFALKGNVMDLAVGVIIGGAFGKITTSLVEDIIMPIISAIMGGRIDFTNMFMVLGDGPAGSIIEHEVNNTTEMKSVANSDEKIVELTFIYLLC